MEKKDEIYLTWFESDKAEIIEDMLDERNVPIAMLPTPTVIRDQTDYVMICKDAFQVLVGIEEARMLGSLDFPAETHCINGLGELIWKK